MKPKKKQFYIPKIDVSELTTDQFYALAALIKSFTGRDFFLVVTARDIKIRERK